MNQPGYSTRTPEYYLKQMEPEVLNSFTPKQLQTIISTLNTAIPKPSPKLIDLRIGLDLIFTRFYIVLFVGKDRRKQQRRYFPEPVSRIGNAIAALLLLLATNLLISLFILVFAYLAKSALGIDLFPHEHLADQIKKF
jgi:hypothetical protein